MSMEGEEVVIIMDVKKEEPAGCISIPRVSSEGQSKGDIWRSESEGDTA